MEKNVYRANCILVKKCGSYLTPWVWGGRGKPKADLNDLKELQPCTGTRYEGIVLSGVVAISRTNQQQQKKKEKEKNKFLKFTQCLFSLPFTAS